MVVTALVVVGPVRRPDLSPRSPRVALAWCGPRCGIHSRIAPALAGWTRRQESRRPHVATRYNCRPRSQGAAAVGAEPHRTRWRSADGRFPGPLDRGQDQSPRLPCSPWLDQLSQVLARRRTVCLRQPHGHHVGQIDDHAILVGLAVIPRTGQDQTAPLIGRPPQAPRVPRQNPRIPRRRRHRSPGEIA